MIKIPNYNVVVPQTPELRLFGKRRNTYEGDRQELRYEFSAADTTVVQLPWMPTAPEWVEVYINGVRLVNPRVTSIDAGTYYEVFNLNDNNIRFSRPVTGQLTIICDTRANHWWGSIIVNTKNVQAESELKNLYNFNVYDWPVSGGSINGFNYRVNYIAGPKFENNSYVIIEDCIPAKFNGNFQVLNGTLGSVNFRGTIPGRETMIKPGTISGFGNAVVKQTQGIALYSEPIILTQPYSGYARLTGDRKSIAYVPNVGYVGNDTFSWSMINQHGQIGEPKCVVINMTSI